jgi:hypothetical protein
MLQLSFLDNQHAGPCIHHRSHLHLQTYRALDFSAPRLFYLVVTTQSTFATTAIYR